mmetsp:Transcript_3209/g.9863  ORF Transcript_3209/g.9863 Transcript_3209/m.9863 type:complete len:221 (+) Transcript_3209:300-962(+)
MRTWEAQQRKCSSNTTAPRSPHEVHSSGGPIFRGWARCCRCRSNMLPPLFHPAAFPRAVRPSRLRLIPDACAPCRSCRRRQPALCEQCLRQTFSQPAGATPCAGAPEAVPRLSRGRQQHHRLGRHIRPFIPSIRRHHTPRHDEPDGLAFKVSLTCDDPISAHELEEVVTTAAFCIQHPGSSCWATGSTTLYGRGPRQPRARPRASSERGIGSSTQLTSIS